MNAAAQQIQSFPIAALWAPPVYTAADLCLFDLISFWHLVDHVAIFDGASQDGAACIAMVEADTAYLDDTTRGGPPGALVFTIAPPSYTQASDLGGNFAPQGSFTLAGYFMITAKAASSVLLSYVGTTSGAVTVYELIFHQVLDRFVWTVQGSTGYNPTVADTIGSPAVGVWYWIEVYFDAANDLAGIRGTSTRTAEGSPLTLAADSAAVPGGIVHDPGQLRIGYTGINSIALGTPLDSFTGRAIALGIWQRELTDTERGILNVPTDHPFTIADPARLTQAGEIRLTEAGESRIRE